MIKQTTVTVDAKNKLPHGTVRRAPTGFAHAILLDQMGEEAKWHIIDLYGPMETEKDHDVADWPIVYVPAPDEVWETMNQPPMTKREIAMAKYLEAPHAEHHPDCAKDVNHFGDCVPECTEDQSAAFEDAVLEENEKPQQERIYPRSGFVVPCKNCDHMQWLHGQKTGECYFRECECSGFEEVPEKPKNTPKVHFSSFVPICLCGHEQDDHYQGAPTARGFACSHAGCPCAGFKEDT